jgi:ribosome-binding factor A
MAHDRPQRVGQLIQEELGRLATRGFKDPRIGFVTFTGVKVSPDLREAWVYWAVHGDDRARQETEAGLRAATGFVKRHLGQELSLRYTPDIRFVYDEAIDRGQRVEELLREIKQQDEARQREGPEEA